MTVLVRAATLTNYQAVARRHGLNTAPLLREAALSRALIDNPDQMIPASAVVALLEASAHAARCPGFGLQIAEGRGLADFGPVSLLLAHQPTLREALQTLMHQRQLVNPALSMRLEEDGDIAVIREELTIGAGAPPRQASELALAVMLGFFRAILGDHWRPVSVSFIHRAPTDLSDHIRVFGCPLEFGSAASAIVCEVRDLDRPNPQANPALAMHARQFIEAQSRPESESIAGDVRRAIILLLPSGRASIATVAQSLGQNVRTLQRRLETEGRAFSDLLDDVRRELALRYLDNPKFRLLHIAEMLGYATPASFTRWFVAQFGEVPSKRRAQSSHPQGDRAYLLIDGQR